MAERKTGLWIIGAWGGVATTAVVGLLNLQKKLVKPIGLTTELPEFSNVDKMPEWDRFVPAGYEIRNCSFGEAADDLINQRALETQAVTPVRDDLAALDERILPGFLANSGVSVRKNSRRAKPFPPFRPT